MKRAMEITAYRCKGCGRIHYPFHDRCLNCKGRDFEAIQPEGKAKLLTFTKIYNLPWGIEGRYRILGIGEFENGVRAMGQILADENDDLHVGQTLEAGWEPVREQYGEHVYGLVFKVV